MDDSLNDPNLDPGTGEARDVLLGEDGDLAFLAGDLVLVRGTQATKQEVAMRCRSWLGEWFLDVTAGVNPERVFTKPPDIAAAQAEFRAQILAATGIASIDSVRASFISRERRLTLDYSARLADGTTLNENLELGA